MHGETIKFVSILTLYRRESGRLYFFAFSNMMFMSPATSLTVP